MQAFPKLRTGAVAQYPLTREVRLRNEAVRRLAHILPLGTPVYVRS